MNTRRMKYILAIVDSGGNLTKAAEKMFISQPALSQILKKVETECDVTLFDRGSNPMRLTRAGERYARAARAMLDIEHSMRRAFEDEKNLERGELHIGVTPFRATYLLPKILSQYHRKYPGIDVILHQTVSSNLARLMEHGVTDVTIGNFPGDGASMDRAVCKKISDEEIVLVTPRDHPLAGTREIGDLRAIRNDLILMQNRGEQMRVLIDDFFNAKGFVPWRVIETTNAEFCLRLIAEGVGVSLMSEAACEEERAGNSPAYVRFAGAPLRMTTILAYMKQRYLPASARAFIRTLMP